VANVGIEARTVYTNNPPCGAMRGFGANQAAFAIEGILDRLAEKVGLDGYDIRERNVLDPGDRFATGQLMNESCGIRRTLEAVREAYKTAPKAGTASRATALCTAAGGKASVKLAEALDRSSLADLAGRSFHGEHIVDFTTPPGADVDEPVTHMTFGYATQVSIVGEDAPLR
jgi:CO/xanthine dehydrogenase Mo-binding subunit